MLLDLIDSNFWGYPSIETYSRVSYRIVSTDNGRLLKIFMPGAKKEDIFVKTEKSSYLCVEYKGKDLEPFGKKFLFDDDVDTDKIKAEYINGILQIILPEKESFTKVIPIA